MRDDNNYVLGFVLGAVLTVSGMYLGAAALIWFGGFLVGGSWVAVDRKDKINEGKDI